MARLFALLVGINEYHPDSKVRRLYGCKQDVEEMAKYLKTNYKDLLGGTTEEIDKNVVVLTDAQATRKAVIQNFQTHLGQAQEKGDIALFYYAGHGSYESTSPEFERLDSKNQNETLICYDSRLSTSYDLADKELAVLINDISDLAEKVIILDSCHSGSATRAAMDDSPKRGRHQPARHSNDEIAKRSLDTYLKELGPENYYQKLQKENKPIEPPISRHILFSACDRDQVAEETLDGRGLFSRHLENVLKQQNGTPISYNELFLQLRRSMLNQGVEQTPKVEPLQGFNANYGFLGLEPVDSSTIPVSWSSKDKQWKMELGATQGLPTDSISAGEIKVKLHEVVEGKVAEKGIDASISAVGVQDSALHAPEATDPTKKYVAKMDFVPFKLTMPVYLSGNEQEKEKFRNFVKDHFPAPYLDFIDAPAGCTYELRLKETIQEGLPCYGIYHIDSGRIIQYIVYKNERIDNPYESFVGNATTTLNQIAKWERIKNLEKSPEVFSAKQVDIEFDQISLDEKDVVRHFDTNDVHVLVEKTGNDWSQARFRFKVKNGTNRDLFFHLVAFLPDFQIYHAMHVDQKAQSSDMQQLHAFNLFFPPGFQGDEFTIYYQLFVSTVELNPAHFNESRIPVGPVATFRFMEGASSATQAEDWFTQGFSITFSKNQGQIGEGNKDFNGITFRGHNKVKAKVSLGSLHNNSRSATTFDQIKMLEGFEGLNLVNLSSSRSDLDKSIVELRDIQGVPEDGNLEADPLKIQMDIKMEEGETIVPITHDGEFIIPIGTMEYDDDGKAVVSITQVPDQPEERKRSVGQALKFAFLKAAAPTTEMVYRLRWVNYEAETKDKRTDADLEQKVQEANRILLLVHGIIGNTKQMADEAKFALKSDENPEGFDLILTFDYENLNGPIEAIAAQLSKALEEVGLGANDNKELFIVAHSMGGLVTRHMIENLREGDDLVDRLIMFGTPNGGSAFSKLPEFVRTLKQLLSIALNFLPINVKGIMELIDQFEKIKKIKDTYEELKDDETVKNIVDGVLESEKYKAFKDRLKILVTLQQMDPESDFLKDLGDNNPAPNTEYYVVAGDISNYKAQGDGWLARLMDKVVVRIGKLIYFGIANDIAVSVKGIKHLPFPVKDEATVICHHMNYFVDEDSVEKWREYVMA